MIILKQFHFMCKWLSYIQNQKKYINISVISSEFIHPNQCNNYLKTVKMELVDAQPLPTVVAHLLVSFSRENGYPGCSFAHQEPR